MRRLILIPLVLLGLYSGGAFASTTRANVVANGRIISLDASSISVGRRHHQRTCGLTTSSPETGTFAVGDRVEIACSNHVLVSITEVSRDRNARNDEPVTTGLSGMVTAVGPGAITVHDGKTRSVARSVRARRASRLRHRNSREDRLRKRRARLDRRAALRAATDDPRSADPEGHRRERSDRSTRFDLDHGTDDTLSDRPEFADHRRLPPWRTVLMYCLTASSTCSVEATRHLRHPRLRRSDDDHDAVLRGDQRCDRRARLELAHGHRRQRRAGVAYLPDRCRLAEHHRLPSRKRGSHVLPERCPLPPEAQRWAAANDLGFHHHDRPPP